MLLFLTKINVSLYYYISSVRSWAYGTVTLLFCENLPVEEIPKNLILSQQKCPWGLAWLPVEIKEIKIMITSLADLTLSEVHKNTPSDFNRLQRAQGSVFKWSQNTWSCSSSAALNLKLLKAFSTETTKGMLQGQMRLCHGKSWKQCDSKCFFSISEASIHNSSFR